MKKLGLTLFMTVFGAIIFAQAPEQINYQAVVRDIAGNSITNQLVGVRVAILQGSSTGPEVFAETHGPTTNSYGLINLQIGTGANTGPALSTIPWGTNTFFVKIEIDPTGGTSYSVSSTSQLVSVPFALYAKTAGNVNDADSDPTNEYNTGAIINADSLEITDGGGTIVVDLTSVKSDPDMDPNNEIQTVSKVGQIVTLSNGGGAFTDDVNDADSDPTNEYNSTLTLVGTTLQLTDGGGTINADLSGLTGDADPDPNNEIQVLNKVGNTVTLSLGGGSFTDEVNDGDADNTNEFQTINKVGNTVTLSDGGGSFTDAVDDADNNATNELQTISKTGNIVTLSNGGGSVNIDDSDASATNEFNTGATLTGTDLNISDGGGTFVVDLSSLVGGGDPSSTNELNTGASLSGTILTVTDPGGNVTVDLASLQDGVNDADADPTNEYNTGAVLSGSDLEITDGGGTISVDLSGLSGGGSDLKVGQYYQGGIIVFVDSTGIHGLICAVTDAGTGVQFEDAGGGGPGGNALNVLASSFTDGAANTAALAGHPDIYNAADLCNTFSAGGFTDWYLPSAFELEMCFRQNYVMALYGASMPMTTYYWSSTQDAPSAGFNAWRCRSNTTFLESTSELNTANVRPVRAF